MKTVRNILGIIIVITIIVVAMRLGVINANTASTIFVIGLLLFVIRPLTNRFAMWFIEFRLSMNPTARKRLEKILFVRGLDSSSTTHLNTAFSPIISGICWLFFGALSFLLWIFQGISGDIVYYTLRDIVRLIELLGGTGGERLLAFLEVILSTVTLASAIMLAFLFVNGNLRNWAPAIVFGISLPVHEIYHWFLFQYSGFGELWFRIWPKLIILVVVVVIVLLLALTENDGDGSDAPSGLSV